MVAPMPVYRECALGKGPVIDRYQGCVIEPFDGEAMNPWADEKNCSCDFGKCKREGDDQLGSF